MKTTTSVTIDPTVLKKAKENNINISGLTEAAIRQKIGEVLQIRTAEVETCQFCGRSMRKATAENLDGLSWLWPDEKWVCPTCLNIMGRNITK